jgi:superfamily II DNA helicase RecQ
MCPAATLDDAQTKVLRVLTACNDRTPLLLVLPTGAGKTMMILAIAQAQSHAAVIIVTPLTSLSDDIVRRAEAAGLNAQRWVT